jgi:hypothetical protein
MSPSEELDIPREFVCPITKAMMKDPVRMPDGYVYERDALFRYVSAASSRSPENWQYAGPFRTEDGRPENLLKARIAGFARKPFEITVHIDSVRSSQDITLEVALWDTIAQLKQRIAAIEPTIGASDLTISSDLGTLGDDATMEDTGVYRTRKLRAGTGGPIYIKVMGPKCLKFRIYPFHTVRDLKRLYSQKTGIPEDKQIWSWCGKVLRDDDVLLQRGIQNGATLSMNFRSYG